MSNRSTYFLKLGVLLFLGMTMVGCSSTGRFMNDNMSTEQVMKELESYTPAWKPTGDSDMDRVGRSAVMSIEDKKPAMDAMFASLWAEYDLMEWTNAAKADLQEKGISWGEADAEQRDARPAQRARGPVQLAVPGDAQEREGRRPAGHEASEQV